jgi:LmbE family N-acetylglucosaminyl deacetylase
MESFTRIPTIAMAVYAHPDDADVAAGGTLATWAQRGCSTHLVIVGDGAKGSHDASASEESLRARRRRELEEAAAELKVATVTSLGYADGEFSNDIELRCSLVELVRRLRPETVLAPDPTATFFGGVYVNHRDHRETGWAVLDAVAPASAMPLYFPEAGEAHAVSDLLLSGTHEPDVVVDVTDSIGAKVEAILRHTSQFAGDADDVRAIIEDRAAQAGREVGVAFGESFRHVAIGR